MGRLNPTALQTRPFALSYLPLDRIHGPPEGCKGEGEEGKRFRVLLEPLSKKELVGVLKWPFCVGEAEKLVLEILQQELSNDEDVPKKVKRPIAFGGDLGTFIEQAESLGIKNHKTPAHRPRLEDVKKELAALQRASESKP